MSAAEGLIGRIVRGSVSNPALILLLAAILAWLSAAALLRTPVDALPDLSDVQVIIRTSYPGQAPRIVEDQVTNPLTTVLVAVPGASAVRGYSFFGDSFVYVLFRDGTDLYWARSRVLEYLSQVAPRLPPSARPVLGPDASGVGWIYEYALVDRSGRHDPAQLRSIQDWFLKLELQGIEGVSEVATVGGAVKEYQVVLDPERMRTYAVSLAQVRAALERANGETGGSTVELAEREYMIRTSGYVRSLADLRRTLIAVRPGGVPLMLADIADVRFGSQQRRGVADLDGEGEVVGGIIVMRQGQDARSTIRAIKARLTELKARLPQGVEVVETYDRSGFIQRAVNNLSQKLVVELAMVVVVCAVFLLHLRAAAVVLIVLPLAVCLALLIMRVQGINANIMSLGGIAIAIGAMADAALVMVENVYKRLESAPTPQSGRAQLVAETCAELAPALFFSLLIAAFSFLPILALTSQEGRLFAPLAYTKTYAMLAAALLSISVVPVLICLFLPRQVRREQANPVNRFFAAVYRPLLAMALDYPVAVSAAALALVLLSAWPASGLGTEFLPQIYEGDLLYMPTVPVGLAIGPTSALLTRTDRLLRDAPEVRHVFGKAGRADSATDPAPLEMFETVIELKPPSEWPRGVTREELVRQLDSRVRLPGLANAWLAPIRARLDMLNTGVRTPLGIKIAGPDLTILQHIGDEVARVVRAVPGVTSVYAEHPAAGRYIEIDIDRLAAARYALAVADVNDAVALAVGGLTIGESLEGRERYPIVVRYPSSRRDTLERLRALPIVIEGGSEVMLGMVAQLRIVEGPVMIRSENAQPAAWVFIDSAARNMGSIIDDARARIDEARIVPPGYSLRWSGQYESWRRAVARLRIVVPLVLAVIVVTLYLNFRRWRDVILVLGSIPFALVGGVWLMWLAGYPLSVASVAGFIALAGVAAETGVVMLIFLNSAWERRLADGGGATAEGLRAAIVEGALMRLRPKLMTAATIIVGLTPMLLGLGAGSEVMHRIAAPMIGGMVSATILTLIVIPALFLLVHGRGLAPRKAAALNR